MSRFRTSLVPGVTAAADARAKLNGWFSDAVGDRIAEAIRLATTELVTNAIRHGGVSLNDEIALLVDLERDVVRVDVEQPGSAAAARVAESPGVDGGFGLAIVRDLSRRWGIVEGQPGHVWFEIAVP